MPQDRGNSCEYEKTDESGYTAPLFLNLKFMIPWAKRIIAKGIHAAALSVSFVMVHTWSLKPLAIAGDCPPSASCFWQRLYHATNSACIAVSCLRLLRQRCD